MSKGARLRTVALSAKALARSGKVRTISQDEACEWFDCTDRTLREWATRGLPTEKGPHGRTVYPVPDATVWAHCYTAMVRKNGKGPRHLTMEQADNWHVGTLFREWPGDYVIVPLGWDDPYRERQLHRAAAGRSPDEPLE